MKKYEQYKDSGVAWIGDIPSHWKVERLKHNSAFINGFAFNSEDFKTDSAGVRVIRIGDIGAKVDFDNCIRATTDPQLLTPYLIKDGDILIAMSGATTGKCCIADNIKTAYINQRVGIIRSDMHKMIYYSLQTPYFKEYVNLNNAGSAQPNISSNAIGEFPIVVMPIEEQQAIVRYLDYKVAKIDQLIAESEVQIEELGKYKTAMISEVVTKGLNPDAPMRDSGIEWIGQIPEHWAVKRIKYVGKAENGLTYAPNDICDDTEGTLVLRSSNIQNGKLAFDDNVFVRAVPDSLKVRKGDIIICSRNGSASLVGKSALVEEDIDACFGAFMMRFRSNLNSKYIHFLLTAAISHYKQLFTTTTINQLTIGLINNIAMPLIENITEQKVVVDYLDKKCADIDSAIKLLNDYVEQLKVYKTALISETVTGQIDVRDWREK